MKLKTELKAEILGELQQPGDDNHPRYADAAPTARVAVRQKLEELNPTRQAVSEEMEEAVYGQEEQPHDPEPS